MATASRGLRKRMVIRADLPLVRWGIRCSLVGLGEVDSEAREGEGGAEVVIQAPEGAREEWCRAGEAGGAVAAPVIICLPRGACLEGHCPAARVAPLEETGPGELRRLVREVLGEAPAGPGAVRLTPRECEVGRLVAEGLSSAAIGERLFISPRTVEKHRANLMGKLGVTNAVGVARELLFLEEAGRE